jgi:hypothetical protein
VHVKASGRRSGSKGEDEGEETGLSWRVGREECELFGKEKARGVGEMMVRVGGLGTSVVTSSAERGMRLDNGRKRKERTS